MAGSEVRLGLITVTYNSGQVLEGFLRCLTAQTFSGWRLYVVDNQSIDGSIAKFFAPSETSDFCSVVINPTNVGFAAATNEGIRNALRDGCTHFLLINNDVEFGPDFLSELVCSVVRLGAEIAVPKMMYFDPPDRLWYAGGRLRALRGYMSAHTGHDEPDNGQYDTERKVSFASGCCLMVSSIALNKIGLLDENFFVYGEDVDFCYRAGKLNVPVWFIPHVRIYHKVSSLTTLGSDFSLFQGMRGQAYFLKKHFSHFSIFWFFMLQAKILLKFFIRFFGAGSAFHRWMLEQRALREGFSLRKSDT